MEALKIQLNNPEAYDKTIKNSLPECADLTVITKDVGMQSGRAIAMVTFTVALPDGSAATVQAATSVKMLIGLGLVLSGRYTEGGYLKDGFKEPNLG